METLYGAIESTVEALQVFEMCRQGRLGRVRRRLHDAERRTIRSGSVFVFDEAESGIRRWTDGRLWSPSRIHGNFLVYRELERRQVDGSRRSDDSQGIDGSRRSDGSQGIDGSSDDWLPGLGSMEGVDPRLLGDHHRRDALDKSAAGEEPGLSVTLLEKKNRTLQRSHSGATSRADSRYVFKRDGLVKRTMSAKVDGHWQHLVCYYSRADFAAVVAGPSASDRLFGSALMAEVRAVRVPIDLVVQQTFRRPPLLLTTSIGGPGRGQIPLAVAPRRASDRDIDNIDRILPSSVVSFTASPAWLGEEEQPRWTSAKDSHFFPMLSGTDEWGGYFLRGGDLGLTPAFQQGD